jgi:hypothetical protein
MLHPHQVRAQMQHHAGFDQPTVDAVSRFVPAQRHPGRQAQPACHAAYRQHGVGAQPPADDFHHLRLAAVTVQHHQPPHARPSDAAADLGQHRDQRLGRQGQRAREPHMLHR